MWINCVLMSWRHPRKYLPKCTKVYLAPDGETEIEGPGYKDSRPFWQTVVDPFDLAGLLTGKAKQKEKFWEDQGNS